MHAASEETGRGASDAEKDLRLPSKNKYRQRAHTNPLSSLGVSPPRKPSEMDWQSVFPKLSARGVSCEPTVADVGCGFGGLLVALANALEEEVVLGMELRARVSQYAADRVKAMQEAKPGKYENAGAIRANCMKHMPNYFRKGQLSRMIFAFPDPHFKATNWKRYHASFHVFLGNKKGFQMRPRRFIAGVLYRMRFWTSTHM